MIDQLKDLKDTYEGARQQIDRGKEPLEDLIKLQNFLKAILEDPTIIIEKVDKDFKRYFFDDFSMGLLKRLTRERSRDDKYLDVIGGILEAYIQLFIVLLKLGQLNQQFFDSIKFLFEFDSILHNYNYQIPEDQLKSLRSANQEWRKELKEGDMVDAIIDENNSRCSGWSQAKISQVNGDVLHLEFIFDTKSADKFVDRWSVEIAQFEVKTKEIWEWKNTVANNQMVDAHDKTVWNKSTILDIKEQIVAPGRNVKMAFIGYRIYVENGTKNDERGTFDGWSNRFDEWVSIYSPRIQPFFSKTQKGTQDDLDLDEDFDNLMQPEEGFERVYAVPRLRKCISSLFIHLINLFGNRGGFDMIIQCLSKQETEEENNMDLNILANLIHCVSYPYLIYHREFIQEYGPKFVELCIKRLREAPEKSLRDVRREKIESIIKSIDNFQRRLIPKDEREKQTEILKLEVSLMCLKSSFLERRIQGIRDLNQIIKNNRMFSNKNFTSQFLIEWMTNNGVFNILFDTKKTHLQLVQRCTDIFKLLLQENMFSPQLMEMFWSLAKTDYKFEVYKIINESSFYLKQEHIDYFFEQIKQVPAEKLAIEEFQCLSELGKYARDNQFKTNVTTFFWQIICNSESYKEELVNNCINKFCEMVKHWDIKIKHDFFLGLTKNLDENKSSIPCIKLFKGLLKDQKERTSYTYSSSSPSKAQQVEEASTDDQTLTLQQSLDILINEQNLVKILLANFSTYCELVKSKLTPQHLQAENRKKLFIVNPKYPHQDEIDERLQFIKYIASISSNYQISKSELGVLYDLLCINSGIQTDSEEFLTWCKSSCEQSTTTSQILDLNEVGEFFTEKMKNGSLDVKNLLVVGFDFLQQYFLSVNETSQKLIKSSKPVKSQKFTNYTYTSITYGFSSSGTYGPKPPNYFNNNKKQEEEDAKIPTFKLQKEPSELDQLDIVWNIALQCENPKVVPKAIDFLIKVYYSLDVDLDDQRIKIQDELIAKCVKILKESNDEGTVKRAIDIIKHVIYEAEKKGTGDVKPHNALLKGELLERISIKNKASPKTSNIVMSIYSNTTFWEFKKEVAKQLELAPKYLKLERGMGISIKDTDNGKTLAELGFQSNDSVTAYKINIEEEVPNAPLIGPDGHHTVKAREVFNEWFDMYSDENGQMTKETCALFIKGCTGEYPGVTDDRIGNLFKTYDSNQDGKIERAEFMTFYETAARSKPDTVRENLRAHNIRNDLKKLSEVQEESSFATDDMPRFKISKNQEYFDLFMELLDRRGIVSEASWDLIQMLATNQELYTRVLQLKTALNTDTGKIDWAQFFDSNSVYRLLYTLQIVEAVMEEGEGEGLERVVIIEENDSSKKKVGVPQAPPLPGVQQDSSSQTPQQDETPEEPVKEEEAPQKSDQSTLIKKTSTIVKNQDEDKKLRTEWTQMFLQHKGFQYILKAFMEKQIIESSHSEFELKHIAFLLKLLRIFIMAAFSTSTESQVYAVANLVRKGSSFQDEENAIIQSQIQEGSRFKELQKLLDGPIGAEIIQQIDYKELQKKILSIISQILVKQKMIFEDKLIIENALSLWVGCNLHMNELLNDFYNFSTDTAKNCDEFILSGLLFCEQDKVREEFKQSLSCLSHKLLQTDKVKEIPLYYLLRLLSDKFSIISQYHCKQYFELFCDLIDQYFMVKHLQQDEKVVFNPENLLALIIDKIKEYNKLASQQQHQEEQLSITNKGESNTEEQESSQNEVSEQENIYIGLIQLTGKIIDNFDISFSEKIVESKNLIDEIFVKFLFASVFKQEGKDSLDNLKIKPKRGQRQETKKQQYGKKSKDAAYKLLNSLIRKSPLLMNAFLEKSMLPLMSLIKKHDGWNYTPPGHSENRQKYVGLKNLGCICYMNSMLQQFFMIPSFRYNLLSVDDKISEDLQEYKGHKVDDNVLHQLQKLMTSLELSERQDYNPFEFCFAFKDLDGNPTNTGEQKDAQEFLNLSFDRIENLLRGTTRKYLLQSVFGGQTCSQVVCLECGKVKNRIEDFYNLSLTVKDIKSMYDSLQKLIEGETINDYECDACKKKVDISKRILISQTPNVLIVHLQRIIFNFDTFRNDKINSFFDFPFQLDLKPYSFYEVMKKENRLNPHKKDDDEETEQKEVVKDEDNQWPEEEDCFEYKLVGVTVHSGTANAGHYWSYINTRRGYTEPEENDPNWQKTETDPWMEYNDSTVREFNFDKMKDECYGGDGKGGNDDAWSFGGTYGKSAYMLVYERKKKNPLKILASQDEIETKKETLQYDAKKEEYFKLVNYRECAEDIAPNQIYKQVFEDNQKFEFENDIYSSEFFDFVKGILQAVLQLDKDDKNQGELLSSVKGKALQIGKKTIMDLLAKCFYNTSIKYLVEALIDIMKNDESLTQLFLEQCFKEDNCNYIIEILLECSDSTARLQVGNLLKFVLSKLKMIEKDRLYETQKVEVETNKGDKVIYEQPVALSTRFIMKCFAILNGQVAKNWSRFENFLEILYTFAVGEEQSKTSSLNPDEQQAQSEEERVGLEFFFKHRFIERACDFLLGKKSPMSTPGEKRFEMGGVNTPNFTPIIKLVTKMITNQELLDKYPLSDIEKNMFLHHDLLKVMLGSPGSKQFGQCLANMCKGNEKMSQKVSKVFIKAINQSNFDNVKSYLKALKPFLKIDDSFKHQKLEWVFGFGQIIQRKTYREEKYKYGLEFVDRINEEANTYVSPIANGPSEESLFSQLLKCKGKLDTFAINCLQEMLSLMSKDDLIARFVYNTLPPTYQSSRYSDWIRPYLEYQKSEVERANSYAYFKNKHDAILKSLEYLEKFEERCVLYREEEKAAFEKAKAEGYLEDVQADWFAYQHPELIDHFPPQLIVGKQAADDKELIVYDENPLVKVVVYEVPCEYNYSNPTGWFNLSLPHIEVKTNNYQTMSYTQYKKAQIEHERRSTLPETNEQSQGENTTDESSPDITDPQEQQPQLVEQEEPEVITRNWFENKKETPVILKVLVTNKEKKKVTVKVNFLDSDNVYLPKSYFKERFLDADTKCLCHLMKIDPKKGWGNLRITVEANEKSLIPQAPSINIGSINTLGLQGFSGDKTLIGCGNCKKMNDQGVEFCEACGENLNAEINDNVQENYFGENDQGPNHLY